jgi:hypothetical protein
MRGKWTALVCALALSCSAAVVAGCGVAHTLDPVAAAATKSEKAGGEKVAMTVGVSAGGKSFTIDANGTFDGNEGDLTMDLSSLLGAAGLSGSGGSAELRFLQENGDPVIYANVPFLSSRIPGGKSWIRLDLEQAGQAAGVDVNQLLGQAAQNPTDALDMLRESGSVTEVGTETLNGEQTTHYKATIDLQKAASKLGGRVQQAVQGMIARGAPSSLPVDVWIGDDGLVRKVTLDEGFSANGHSDDVNLTVVFSDYGTPVTVVAPPADQTLDLSGIIGALSQGAASTH